MPWVRFEPMIPASERGKIVHALDRSATMAGHSEYSRNILHSTIIQLSTQEIRHK
jgi:hypothetical protein